MGFTDRLKQVFGQDGKEKKPIEKTLESWGLKVIADKKLDERLLSLQEFFDELDADITTEDPGQYLTELRTRQEKLNRAIHSLAVPYYRAGSSAQFREIMEGWQLWHSLALYWIDAIEDRIESIEEEKVDAKDDKNIFEMLKVTTIDIKTLVRRLHTVLQLHVWQDGQLVMAESYQNLDVSGSSATIIKTVPSHGGIDLSEPVSETV